MNGMSAINDMNRVSGVANGMDGMKGLNAMQGMKGLGPWHDLCKWHEQHECKGWVWLLGGVPQRLLTWTEMASAAML